MLFVNFENHYKWSVKNKLQPMIEDGEYSFSLMLIFFNNMAVTSDFFALIDMFVIK